jgi:hypothetical protein
MYIIILCISIRGANRSVSKGSCETGFRISGQVVRVKRHPFDIKISLSQPYS